MPQKTSKSIEDDKTDSSLPQDEDKKVDKSDTVITISDNDNDEIPSKKSPVKSNTSKKKGDTVSNEGDNEKDMGKKDGKNVPKNEAPLKKQKKSESVDVKAEDIKDKEDNKKDVLQKDVPKKDVLRKDVPKKEAPLKKQKKAESEDVKAEDIKDKEYNKKDVLPKEVPKKEAQLKRPKKAESEDVKAEDIKDKEDNKKDVLRKDVPKKEVQLKRPKKAQSEDAKAEDIKDKFMLKISNFPSQWDFTTVQKFLLKEFGPVNIVYMAGDDNPCCVLEFSSLKECTKVRDAVHDKVVDDEKLIAEIRDSYTGDSDEETSPPKKKKKSISVWRPDIDIWKKDPLGLYGFKREYLTSLGIKPPLDRWVHVSNFRCDKSELKEAMELAGEVLLCCVDSKGPKTANVMYSHPIEAVQAVSMLNNQPFYGQALTVTIQKCPDGTTLLPKGLNAVGPGLGNNGIALRDVVRQYQRFATNKTSLVNTDVFCTPNSSDEGGVEETQVENTGKEFDKPKTTKTQTNSNGSFKSSAKLVPPGTASPSQTGVKKPVSPVSAPLNFVLGRGFGILGNRPLKPASPNVGPMYSNPGVMGLRPGPGPMGINRPMGPIPANVMPMGNPRPAGPIGPMGLVNPGQMGGPSFGPGPNSGFNGPRNVGPMNVPGPGPMVRPMGGPMMVRPMGGPTGGPMGGPMGGPIGGPISGPGPAGGNGYTTVELSNLPLSTTFTLLCEKMAECGQVISLQLTTPGCAVVQFSQRMQAERCFHQSNTTTAISSEILSK